MGDKHTQIPNEILEALPTMKLNGTQYAICLVVWRYTFGFHRCETRLSTSFLAKATNRDARQIKRELHNLVERCILTKIDGKTAVIGFNKNISDWLLVNNPPKNKKVVVDSPVVNSPPSGKFTTPPVVNSPPKVVVNSPPKKERKENSKENIYSLPVQKVFSFWNEQKITVHKSITGDIKKAIDGSLKKHSIDEILLAIKRYSQIYHDSDYYFSYKWSLVNFVKQRNALSEFLDEGEKWENYLARGQPKGGDSETKCKVPLFVD
jgi:phage replication O-like protein O